MWLQRPARSVGGGSLAAAGVLWEVAPRNSERRRSSVSGTAERERRIAELAARQHRVAGDDQLVTLGLGRDAIRYRIEIGRLQRVHHGVVAIGPGPLHQRGRWWAALLACRPGPALSHLSSAAARGLAAELGAVHVTVPRRTTIELEGVTIHSARRLDPLDLDRSEDGLPITALHRTLLDLAEVLPFERFETIFEEADRRSCLDLDAITACMKRNPGRHGLKPLRRLLADYLPVEGANEGLERRFQKFIRAEGFPPPQMNVLVDGLLVDCFWPELDFVIELDSRGYHSHRKQFDRDRSRDGVMLRGGHRYLRVTDRRLVREREQLVADLAAVLPRGSAAAV